VAKLNVEFTLTALVPENDGRSLIAVDERECSDVSILDHILHLTLKHGSSVQFKIRVIDYNLSHHPDAIRSDL